MENLNLEKFNPKKAELEVVINKYKNLQITGVEDKEGYLAVKEARKDLQKKRKFYKDTGLELRGDANAFAKKVLKVENEIIALIEPEEAVLKGKQEAIDKIGIMIARKALLPIRIEKLAEFGVVVDEAFLLELTDVEFSDFMVGKQKEYLENKAAELKAQEDKLSAAKAMQDAIDAAAEKTREEEAAKAKLAEQKVEQDKIDKEREHELALKKLEDDKILAEQNRKDEIKRLEDEKIEAVRVEKQKALDENIAKEKEQARIDAEKIAKQQKLEKQKAYTAFLAKYNFVDDGSFKIIVEGDTATLYKKLGEFKNK